MRCDEVIQNINPFDAYFLKELSQKLCAMRPFNAITCAFLLLNSVLAAWTLTPSGQRPMWYLDDPTLNTGVCMYAYINTTQNTSDGGVGSEYWASGKFGENSVGPAYGVLIHVRSEEDDDPTACTLPLITHSTPDRKLPVSEPWIALIKRGECAFVVKIVNAINNSASAVIVYDDRETTDLDTMRISSELRSISAVLTFKKTGERWASLVDGGVRVMANITVGNPCSRDDVNFNRTSVLFLSISFIVLMVVALAWLTFYYVQRFRYVHNKDRLSKRLCSAAKKALSKIPTKNVKSEDKEIQGDGECCAVCIEPYRLSDVLRILPCKHEFHRMCVDPWLLEHRTCPMCKMDILKHYGFIFTGSQESILHMEIEDAAAAVNNDTDRLQQRSRNSVSQIRPPEHETLGSVSPESDSNSSWSSSPDDVSPTLHSDQCYTGVTSHPGESSSLMDTSTQCSRANAGAHHKSEKCSNCMLGISVHESTDRGSNKCDTSDVPLRIQANSHL